MNSVWIVSGSDYDDHGPVAAFTTQELAEAYAAPKALTVDEFTIFDRIPALVTLHCRGATILRDGTVQRSGNYTHEFWDSDVPGPVVTPPGWRGTEVIVWGESKTAADLACLEEVKAVLGSLFEEDGHSVEWLAAAVKNAAQVIAPPLYVPPQQACYDASFGRVHVRPGCTCGR